MPPFSELRPEMTPRGFVSFCFDGRYKFARYYAPDNFNTPTTFEELVGNNDLELFDLERDPDEMVNLAVDTRRQPRTHPAPERAAQPPDRARGRRQRRQLPARDPAPTLTGRRSIPGAPSFGEDASLRAAKCADALLADGDLEGAAVWRAILSAIEELQRGQKL